MKEEIHDAEGGVVCVFWTGLLQVWMTAIGFRHCDNDDDDADAEICQDLALPSRRSDNHRSLSSR
jgi:hypothetical protein